jgi:hypothetical protein
MNMDVIWVVAACSLEEVYYVPKVLNASIIRITCKMMDAASTSETVKNF